jgi:hypothetical protein
MRTRIAIVAALLLLLAALPMSVSAAKPGGFAGNWVAIDCATNENPEIGMDCDVWGDGSTLTLHIGTGATPQIVYKDSYSMECALGGSSSTRWVASGSGYYESQLAPEGDLLTFLFPVFDTSGCGSFAQGDPEPGGIYWDAGSDTLWEGDPDGDGWGHDFVRSH